MQLVFRSKIIVLAFLLIHVHVGKDSEFYYMDIVTHKQMALTTKVEGHPKVIESDRLHRGQ